MSELSMFIAACDELAWALRAPLVMRRRELACRRASRVAPPSATIASRSSSVSLLDTLCMLLRRSETIVSSLTASRASVSPGFPPSSRNATPRAAGKRAVTVSQASNTELMRSMAAFRWRSVPDS